MVTKRGKGGKFLTDLRDFAGLKACCGEALSGAPGEFLGFTAVYENDEKQREEQEVSRLRTLQQQALGIGTGAVPSSEQSTVRGARATSKRPSSAVMPAKSAVTSADKSTASSAAATRARQMMYWQMVKSPG